jgi:predicted nucleic acid-binding protein
VPGHVVDASVAVKWVLLEDGSNEALAAVSSLGAVVAPALLLVEVANAIRKRVRAGQIEAALGLAAFKDLLAVPMTRIETDEALAQDALTLALELGHPVQDCLYLALALRTGSRVLTADRKFARAVRANNAHAGNIVLLGE